MTSTGKTWRSAAYVALSELERKSEAVYNRYPKAHLITEVDALSDMMKEAWPNDFTILFELQMLSLYAIRELIRIGEWDKHELAYLLTTKQHDYGTGNILAFGMIGIAVRMTDKLARLKISPTKQQRTKAQLTLCKTSLDTPLSQRCWTTKHSLSTT